MLSALARLLATALSRIDCAVRALPGITHARVNFTTRRLTAEWQDGRQDAQAIVAAVEGAGFDARPFSPSDVAAQGGDPASRRLIKAMAVAGFAAIGVTWEHGQDLEEDQIALKVRTRTGEDLGAMSLADFAAKLHEIVDSKARQ